MGRIQTLFLYPDLNEGGQARHQSRVPWQSLSQRACVSGGMAVVGGSAGLSARGGFAQCST